MKVKTLFALLTVTFAGSFIFSACKKTDEPVSDYPVIAITSPTSGQMIMDNADVHITGLVTASATDDARLLHEVSIKVMTLPDSTIVFTADYSTHDFESFAIDTMFSPNVTQDQDMLLIALAENHIPKITTSYVPFMVHP